MRLRTLTLKNFRRFDELQLTFHERLTAIAARNGLGKTTVLEAAATALGPFVGVFPDGTSPHIKRSDARLVVQAGQYEQEQAFPVELRAESEGPHLSWMRALNSAKGKTTTKEAAPLTEYGKTLLSQLQGPQAPTFELPLLCYYSSKRLWVGHKQTDNKDNRSQLTASRAAAYLDCLSERSSEQQLVQWLKEGYSRLVQSTSRGETDLALQARLSSIEKAVNQALHSEGWGDFHYDVGRQCLVLKEVQGTAGHLPLELLSDGVRAMVMLVADLAVRCSRLNPHLDEEAPRLTPGVVLIDEVDLHLHPAWQQRALGSLLAIFENLQFIVSTHSPQVLSTLKSEQIRYISQDSEGRWQSLTPTQEVVGLSSHRLLADIMGVDPVPQDLKVVALRQAYETLIAQGHSASPEGEGLLSQLTEIYGPGHEVLLELKRLVALAEFKARRQSARG